MEPKDYPNVLTVDDAVLAQLNRKECKISDVNVIGYVTAQSEILKIKKDLVYLLKLSGEPELGGTFVNVLLRETSHLGDWDKVEVGREYVITHIKPTTLFKGHPNESKIFVACAETTLNLKETYRQKTVTLQAWCKEHPKTRFPEALHTPSILHEDTKHLRRLISYEGSVTSSKYAKYGLYELDKQISLYIAHSWTSPKWHSLNEGSKIRVVNVHHSVSKQEPKIRLCCCALGCVKVRQSVRQPADQRNKPRESDNSAIGDLIQTFMLDICEITRVLETQRAFITKFSPKVIREASFTNVMKTRNADEKSLMHKLLVPMLGEPRNASWVDEFLSPDHISCGAMVGREPRITRISVTMKVVLEHCKSESKQLAPPADILTLEQLPPNVLNEKFYWNYRVIDDTEFKPPWLLCGVLKADKKKGHVILADQTGAIPCVILPTKDSPTPSLNPQHTHPSHPQTQDVGRVIVIDRFKLVLERIIVSHFQSVMDINNENFISKRRDVWYLIFSMENVRILNESPKRDGISTCDDASTMPIDSKRAGCTRGDVLSIQNTRIETKRNHRPLYHEDIEPFRSNKRVKMLVDSKSVDEAGFTNVTMNNSVANQSRIKSLSTTECLTHTKSTTSNSPYRTKYVKDAVCIASQLFVLLQKDTLQIRGRYSGSPQLGFTAVVVYIGKSEFTEMCSRNTGTGTENIGNYTSTRHITNVENVAGTQNQASPSRHSSNETLNLKRNAGQTIRCTQGGIVKNTQPQISERKSASSASQNIVLLFQGCNIKHYHTMHHGAVYKLVKRSHEIGDTSPFSPRGSNDKLQRALDKQDTTQTVLFCDEWDVVFVDTKNNDSADEESQISQHLSMLLHDGRLVYASTLKEVVHGIYPERSLVSVRGVITSRNFCPLDKNTHKTSDGERQERCNQMLGVSVPLNRHMKLLLRDIEDPGIECKVYINIENTSYPLGLLPGTVVDIYRVQRRTSKNDQLYLQYTSMSSIHLVSRLKHGVTQNRDLPYIDTTSAPHLYLHSLNLTTPPHVFTVHCHITMVLKLHLMSVCVECGAVYRGNRCTKSTCGSADEPNFTAKSSFIMDDGTNNAIVHCKDTQVQQLLGFTTEQWAQLQHMCKLYGEIAIEQKSHTSDLDNPAERLLYVLCQTNCVKRDVTICARRFRENFKTNTSLQDIPLKSMDFGQGTFKTRSMPMQTLMCLSIDNIMDSNVAAQLLRQVNVGEK